MVALRALVEVLVWGAVEPVDSVNYVLSRMRVHNIKEHADSKTVSLVVCVSV
jgi:hypothetical protein